MDTAVHRLKRPKEMVWTVIMTFDKYKDWERYGVQPQIHIAQVYATMKGSN